MYGGATMAKAGAINASYKSGWANPRATRRMCIMILLSSHSPAGRWEHAMGAARREPGGTRIYSPCAVCRRYDASMPLAAQITPIAGGARQIRYDVKTKNVKGETVNQQMYVIKVAVSSFAYFIGRGIWQMKEASVKKMMFDDYPDVVDIKQMQKMIGVSRKTVYNLLRNGEIVCRKIGREYRIPKINIIDYMN